MAWLGAEPGGDAANFGNLLINRAVEVGAAMPLGHRNRHADALGAGFVGRLGAAQIRREGDHGEIRIAGFGALDRFANDLRGIGHLRQQLGGHEAANFDLRQAGIGQGGNPAMLHRRWHDGLDDLQPVPRANLTHHHCFSHDPRSSCEFGRKVACRDRQDNPRRMQRGRQAVELCHM